MLFFSPIKHICFYQGRNKICNGFRRKNLCAYFVGWERTKGVFRWSLFRGHADLTDKHLMFVRKTEAKMRWWGAVTQRQVIKFIRSKDVMITQDGYTEESLRTDLENKKNQEIRFDDILYIEFQDKTWGSALLMEIIEKGDKKKYQFSVVQDWVKYPLKAPMKYMKVDWSRFVKHIKDRQMVTK